MLTARIKIGSDSIRDTQYYGLVYLDSDKRVGPDSKGFETTQYPEEEGEHVIPKTVDAPFDYKVKFFIDPSVPDPIPTGKTTDDYTVSKKIEAFNRALFTPIYDAGGVDTKVKEYKKVEFYNDCKRHLIVGYPTEIAIPEDFWRDPSHQVNDIMIVEWTIRVVKPSECNFYAAEAPST